MKITTRHIPAALIGAAIAAMLCFLFWAAQQASGQAGTDQDTAPDYTQTIPLEVEFIDGDVAIQKVGPGTYVITDKGLHTKIDAIATHLGLNPGADPEPKPNINTIPENQLFGILAGADVYFARSKAALIWSWIHDQGNTITSHADLMAIPGVAEKTVDPLWPLIQTSD